MTRPAAGFEMLHAWNSVEVLSSMVEMQCCEVWPFSSMAMEVVGEPTSASTEAGDFRSALSVDSRMSFSRLM